MPSTTKRANACSSTADAGGDQQSRRATRSASRRLASSSQPREQPRHQSRRHARRRRTGSTRLPAAARARAHAPTGCQAVLSSVHRLEARERVAHRLVIARAGPRMPHPRHALGGQAVDLGARARRRPTRPPSRSHPGAPASAGASSARRPDSRFTTPPGTSDTPSTSARSSPASGAGLRQHAPPPCCRRPAPGASSATRPSSSGCVGRHEPTTPVGSGREKDRNGAATGLIPPSTGCELVGPAGVVDEHVDGRVDLGALRADLGRPRLQRLGGAVEDLAAVVGGARRPRTGCRRARP